MPIDGFHWHISAHLKLLEFILYLLKINFFLIYVYRETEKAPQRQKGETPI